MSVLSLRVKPNGTNWVYINSLGVLCKVTVLYKKGETRLIFDSDPEKVKISREDYTSSKDTGYIPKLSKKNWKEILE